MSEKLVDNFKILDDFILEYKQKYENFSRPISISYKVGNQCSSLKCSRTETKEFQPFECPDDAYFAK